MINLLDLIGHDTLLKRTSAHGGGEYSGPCPLCRCGTDRFKVWPQQERWACLGPEAGRAGCDRGGDAIQYLRERDGLGYREACERLCIKAQDYKAKDCSASGFNASGFNAKTPRGQDAKEEKAFAPWRLGVESPLPPNARWQAHARGWAAACEAHLWRAEGAAALAYLRRRGLGDDVLRAFHVGYNPCDCRETHEQWGLERSADGPQHIWIPRGITLPWFSGGAIWRFNVRRPLTPAQIARGAAKYIGPAGFANALYNADALPNALPGAPPDALPNAPPVVLVEGEIDALTIVQAFRGAQGGEVTAVATGSTAGARRGPWIKALAAAPLVLLAFDNDAGDAGDAGDETAPAAAGAGDKAAAWWCSVLPNARRWRPLLHDVNTRPTPAEVRAWLAPAL